MINERYKLFHQSSLPVTAMAMDYPHGYMTHRHHHPHAQLIHAVRGVMLIGTDQGQWIVPPTRGVWMPPHVEHWVRMIGEVQMRTAYIRPDAAPDLFGACKVVGISPLLRELLLSAIEVSLPYEPDSRAGHLMQLLLDEIKDVQSLTLQLPNPHDTRLKVITTALTLNPDDATTVEIWAERLHITPKTIHRLFSKETGMTFGQWRQQIRLLAALERLAQGEKVLTVALGLGYSSQSAFAAMFKRQFGMPPSQFFD
ncbi:AraC family transcriptional regulator [Aquirhabdus sp.]|uniref:AraC family transcriptional regulator n=1 Tax=Aquirhabdus sp. TaxID=2824160 RepID=UPI00396C9B43